MIKYDVKRKSFDVYIGNRRIAYREDKFGKYAESIANESDMLCVKINNHYEFKNDLGIIKLFSKLHGYFDVLFDKKYFNLVSQYKWYIKKDNNNFYCESRDINDTSKRMKLHNLILGEIPEDYIVDHKNRNGLDNTKKNLRIVSTSINARNYTCRNNKLQFNGVCKDNKGYIRAYYRKLDGTVKEKGFNILKYGEDIALNKAILYKYEKGIQHGYMFSDKELKMVKEAKLLLDIV